MVYLSREGTRQGTLFFLFSPCAISLCQGKVVEAEKSRRIRANAAYMKKCGDEKMFLLQPIVALVPRAPKNMMKEKLVAVLRDNKDRDKLA